MGQHTNAPSSSFPWAAVLSFLGVVIAAYIGYLSTRSQPEVPAEPTKPAEPTRPAEVIISLTPQVISITPENDSISTEAVATTIASTLIPTTIAPTLIPTTIATPISDRISDGEYHIQTIEGCYLAAEKGGDVHVNAILANRTDENLGSWTVFTFVLQDDGRYAIITSGDYYLSADQGGGMAVNGIVTDLKKLGEKVGGWEKFTLELQGNGSFAIKTRNGINYLTVTNGGCVKENAIRTNATVVKGWERFFLIPVDNR
jgi:hypothetical protein